MKVFTVVLLLLGMILAVYFMGPTPDKVVLDPTLPDLDVELVGLESWVQSREEATKGLKPDNESRIIWADSAGHRTEYSFVYLHGFSASPMEGRPLHQNLAEAFGANLYLHRLVGHGVDGDSAFLDLTPETMIESAKEALVIGQLLGEKVIILSCSTGGTLSLYLSAHHDVHAQLLYSPNIDFAKAGSDMLTKPWGLQLARQMFGGYHRSLEDWPEMTPYWTMRYRLEGLIALKSMVEATMVEETFENVEQPLFLAYYYESEEEQDEIVSVAAMLEMYESVSTPEDYKRKLAAPEAGGHVIISDILSEDITRIEAESKKFCEEVLDMKPNP